MKSINTLSIVISFFLTALISLFLTSASVQASQLPTIKTEKAERVTSKALKQMAAQTLAQNMMTLQLTPQKSEPKNLLVKQFNINKAKKLSTFVNVDIITE